MNSEKYFKNTPEGGVCFAFCDGAGPRVRNARKCMGTGAVLLDQFGTVFFEGSWLHFSDKSTNVLAEFLAIEDTLRAIEAYQSNCGWVVYCDNEYVVDAVAGYAPVRKPHLEPVMARIAASVIRLRGLVRVMWLPREQNNMADKLSKAGFDTFGLDYT